MRRIPPISDVQTMTTLKGAKPVLPTARNEEPSWISAFIQTSRFLDSAKNPPDEDLDEKGTLTFP